MFGGGARFGGVDSHGESGFGDHVDALVGQLEIAYDMVVQVLGANRDSLRAYGADFLDDVNATIPHRWRAMASVAVDEGGAVVQLAPSTTARSRRP
jgi:hypothetical protein